MFRNFFKTAIRFFWHKKSYTILNYLCLTFGLTCAIVAALNMNRVFNYDKFHINYDRLYEVNAHVTYFNGDRFPNGILSASLPGLLKENIPEIETYSRVVDCNYEFYTANESISEQGIYAEPEFLEIFSFPLKSGSAANVLSDNNSIVISERMAMKFFRTTDCIGRAMQIKVDSAFISFTISGVLKNIPGQSCFQFDYILPFAAYLARNSWSMESGANACQTWVLLNRNASRKQVDEKMKDLIKFQETTLNQELFLFPLKEKILYFYSGGRRVWREMQNVVLIGSIGFAILLIACFNFINLTIALNIKRFREVGIRKVVGAQKIGVVFQQMGEAVILVLLSLATSLDLVKLSVNVLNRLFNGEVHFDFGDIGIIMIFTGIGLFAAVASGMLPALYLSSPKPVEILRGSRSTGHSFSFFRQGLIVFQFTIPIVLMIIVLIIRAQDRFIRNYDLGFDKGKMLIVHNTPASEVHSESIRAELLSIPGIETVSFTNCIPGRNAKVTNEVGWEGKDVTQKLHFWLVNTDFSYDKAVNLKITEGRYFDKSFPSDSSGFLINDIAARVMNYENPVGRAITIEGRKGIIVGVFADFHSLDLSGPYTPTVISLSNTGRSSMLIRTATSDYSQLSGRILEALKKHDPEGNFQVNAYSDLLKRTELTTASYLVGVAFVISILLAIMGLTGLASFTASGRTKEIGIRKINGATVFSIIRLLGLNYSRWLSVATLISLPFAFILGSFFLARFNFRPSMPYWTFVAGPAIAWIVALGAISWQSWRAASGNPVEALRYE